ncbi:regulator of G-protein signaling 22 [Pempheris klunzingeri]|uniref:regulator of G-protein signaling 22 n=1 Tax=Pempheris klunzingeri TaxID=3127111 RepID=UPI0039801864
MWLSDKETDFPENSLASDGLLVYYFNDFLSLPSFPEALLYNPETELYEVESGAAEFISRRIRSVLHHSKTTLLTGDSTLLGRTPPVDNHYTVCCLDREQGIQWIMKERLPFFLQSDCYSEYRLAKLLFQWDPNLQRRKSSSGRSTLSAPQLRVYSQFDKENKNALKVLTHSRSQENISAKQAPSAGISEEQHLTESGSHNYESSDLQLESLAARVVKEVLNNALNVMDGQSQANTDCFSQTNCTSTDGSGGSEVCQRSADGSRERLVWNKDKVQEGKRGSGVEEKTEWFKKNWEVGRKGTDQENVLHICCYGSCCRGNRPGLDDFKEFLRGTPGEKLLNLWMDIERLKATQNKEQKSRHLVLMRSWYLLSSSQSSLNVELLSRLGLTTSLYWTEEKLCSVQPFLTESLLYYWAPRFWTSRCVQADHNDSPHLRLRTEWCVSPLSVIQPHQGSLIPPPHRPDTCLLPHTDHTQLLDSSRMEKMLQALSVESCAGLYFTNFCEQSGNQLWENAVNFWTDLQHYRELFYQDGLDAYRVQRQAQLLYSTYLFSSARRSIGVDEEVRREVYNRLMPAFEELFDKVEEHTLNILMEPWTLLVSRDKESFQKVCVQEEVRCVDTQEHRELQRLYEESQHRLKQVKQCGSMLFPSAITPSTPFSEGPRAPDSWSRVSPNFQGYRLGSLLRHRHEIGHFMSFLQKQDASIHLTCWLDMEQYRRTPQKDKAVRQERSSHIATKYLNRKYFFGSDSPATTEQQNDILRLAGGLERLKLDCLSNPVVMEIQDMVRNHIEKEWLPLFLSTAEFTERQRRQPKPQAADRPSQHVYRRRRTRREAWKAEGLWMSSSKEILLFRRILLDPVTCTKFQHFVSLKGDFLENDVLFWLEVQRYKDLCHSHSDDTTIQQKISTIINCFIDSSMPPALQIDIPSEQAQHILEKRNELGPYIFREAQMSVFSELLKFWPEFQELSSSVQEEQLLPLLQEKRVKHRARVRRQRRKEEEEEEEDERRRAQEQLKSPESSLREEEETDDEDEVEEEGRSEKKPSRTQGKVLLTPTQPLSWSYSKYMAALKREEVLLRRQSQLEASFSTASGSSSDCSFKSRPAAALTPLLQDGE